jgi:hypothetical protein
MPSALLEGLSEMCPSHSERAVAAILRADPERNEAVRKVLDEFPAQDLWRRKERCTDELRDLTPHLQLQQQIHELIKTYPQLNAEWTTWALLNVVGHELASIPDKDQRVVMTADRCKLLIKMVEHFADDYRQGNMDDDDA